MNVDGSLIFILVVSLVMVGVLILYVGVVDDGNVMKDGNLMLVDSNGNLYVVNMMQLLYQLFGNVVVSGNMVYVDLIKVIILLKQFIINIGDLLIVCGVDWVWYVGVWNVVFVDVLNVMCSVIYSGLIQFQLYYQLFNYFSCFDLVMVIGVVECVVYLCDYDVVFL